MSGKSNLSEKTEALIAALLSEPTHEAAAKAGISTATLRRYLHHPKFQRAYLEDREQVLQQTVGHLLSVCSEAVKSLKDNRPV